MPSIEQTVSLVSQIADANGEISTSMSLIRSAFVGLEELSHSNNASSEEISATAGQLAAQADSLRDAIAFFELEQEETGLAEADLMEVTITLDDDFEGDTPEETVSLHRQMSLISAKSAASKDTDDAASLRHAA